MTGPLLELALRALEGAPLEVVERQADEAVRDGVDPETARRLVAAAAHRSTVEDGLRRSQEQLAEAQRLGRMGSYDWDIASDTNDWSDELYRIYGFEPGAFNASYDRFMSLLHPEDRERIQAVHRQALATGEPYEMEERIIRPDGQVRLLASWGEVVLGADGAPVRMRGICQDVTEQREAERRAAAITRRLEALIEAAPDAVLVVDERGLVEQVNGRVRDVLGQEPSQLVGQPVADVLPDDSQVPVEVVAADLDGAAQAIFVRDISERLRAIELDRRLREEELRRRHALEINDNVVQSLVVALYADELGQREQVSATLAQALEAARSIIDDLVEDAGPVAVRTHVR